MPAWKRAVAFGFLSWVIPFVVSFGLFGLKGTNARLFETLMALVVLATAGVLFELYFRGRTVTVVEAISVGILWTVVNLALDYPMFSYGPMKMPPSVYYSEIGLGYLAFPAFGYWASRLARP